MQPLFVLCVISCATICAADMDVQDAGQSTDVTVEQARKIVASSRGPITLKITTLTAEVAAELAKAKGGWLSLNSVTALSPEAAAELAKHEGYGLMLNGLTTLSPQVAAELAKYKGGYLRLNGLSRLSAEAVTSLAGYQGRLSLDGEKAFIGLETLTPELAAAVAKLGSTVALNGLTSLSPEAAQELAKHRGHLKLPRVLKATPGVAEAMAEHKNGAVEWTGFVGLQPDGKTASPIALAKGGNAKRVQRKDSDSATLKLEAGPQLFFREGDSKEFTTAGPKLDGGRKRGRSIPPLCWSFSPDGRLVAVGYGFRDKQRLEGGLVPVSLGYIRVYEVPTGNLVMETEDPFQSRLGAVSTIGFSEDGKTVLFEADAYASEIN